MCLRDYSYIPMVMPLSQSILLYAKVPRYLSNSSRMPFSL